MKNEKKIRDIISTDVLRSSALYSAYCFSLQDRHMWLMRLENVEAVWNRWAADYAHLSAFVRELDSASARGIDLHNLIALRPH